MKNELTEIELRKIIHQVLEEHTDIIYIPDLAPYILEKLGNAGFRRVGDNTVVISKDEYYELMDKSVRNAIHKLAEIGDAIENARNVTAREIFADIERTLHDFYSKNSILTCYDALNHIAFVADKYGVEVEK